MRWWFSSLCLATLLASAEAQWLRTWISRRRQNGCGDGWGGGGPEYALTCNLWIDGQGACGTGCHYNGGALDWNVRWCQRNWYHPGCRRVYIWCIMNEDDGSSSDCGDDWVDDCRFKGTCNRMVCPGQVGTFSCGGSSNYVWVRYEYITPAPTRSPTRYPTYSPTRYPTNFPT
eukprot:Hpha_TRINITY_DN34162_c0_g1::TRINITY_DN34162_c0_g1_i1::g.75957::m.75957